MDFEDVDNRKQPKIPIPDPEFADAEGVMTTPTTMLQQANMVQPIQQALRLAVSEAGEQEITNDMKIDATKTAKL